MSSSEEEESRIKNLLQNSYNEGTEYLYLDDEFITDIGVRVIVDELKNSNPNTDAIKELYLSGKSFSTKGCQKLGELLQVNITLEGLYLCNNNINENDGCIQYIADGLKDNTTLKSLYLSRNNIGKAGCTVLANALKANTTLKELILFKNNFNIDGAKILLQVLQNGSNTSLTTLLVSCSDNDLVNTHSNKEEEEELQDKIKFYTLLNKCHRSSLLDAIKRGNKSSSSSVTPTVVATSRRHEEEYFEQIIALCCHEAAYHRCDSRFRLSLFFFCIRLQPAIIMLQLLPIHNNNTGNNDNNHVNKSQEKKRKKYCNIHDSNIIPKKKK